MTEERQIINTLLEIMGVTDQLNSEERIYVGWVVAPPDGDRAQWHVVVTVGDEDEQADASSELAAYKSVLRLINETAAVQVA